MADLGGRTVSITHPGLRHTRHHLIVSMTDRSRPVVLCGDLVEESGDPVADANTDVAAWPATERLLKIGGPKGVFVPGHGAVVDIAFVRRPQRWLLGQVRRVSDPECDAGHCHKRVV